MDDYGSMYCTDLSIELKKNGKVILIRLKQYANNQKLIDNQRTINCTDVAVCRLT